ncbi:hypothetical protein VB834_08625 [Limnoraphis robusta Tam1]|uniref:Uncharacterized protein n=1 Tax=Limnoraphis robusta CCNP1315 TaxID=3110306 RepID=A0ABU5TSI4_9CYAN|nr:hypothetical protein [Limnoraphis robusta]MEA5517846.1 hypothetical protein [Limnoraphis robusta CCNP1315]MEA5539095.1 hypothetical protein [Limnoraphis robusta Tam1]MEA5546348.1 hypothetical protein [Limnoraphis robusta CCNP1324]
MKKFWERLTGHQKSSASALRNTPQALLIHPHASKSRKIFLLVSGMSISQKNHQVTNSPRIFLLVSGVSISQKNHQVTNSPRVFFFVSGVSLWLIVVFYIFLVMKADELGLKLKTGYR